MRVMLRSIMIVIAVDRVQEALAAGTLEGT